MKTPLIALCAMLFPATAYAEPDEPLPPETEPETEPAPAPAPAPPPTIIVNPPAAPAPATVYVGPRYETRTDTVNPTVFLTGLAVFSATYGASVITAASTDGKRGNDRLYVPIAGPWLALNDRGSCDITLARCDNETTAKVLLVTDGVFQAAGALLMLDGVLQPSSSRVVTHYSKVDKKVHVTPASMAHGAPGVAVFGKF